MADKKIINLPALSVQASTDLYENSANGTGSFKETRAQMLAYTAANIADATYTVGDLIYADSTTTLGNIHDIAVNNVLTSGGIGVVPAYGKVTYAHMQTETAHSLLGNPTGSTAAVSEITLGAGLAFDGTTLTATADSNVTLQDAYNNGVSPNQGDIAMNANNLNPIATFNGYTSGSLVNYQEHFSAVNTTTDDSVFWGYGFRAPNSSAINKDFAHIYANIENNTAGGESGTLGLYASSLGVLTPALVVDGANQKITSTWPMTIADGARTYQTTKLLTGDITYSIDYTGAVILSNDLADHTITINNYFSTSGDDSFIVQTQSTNVVTVTLSGGVTINSSGSDFIVPVNTRATFQLVNAGTKAYMVTMDSVPTSPVAFSAYATTAQNGVTGSGTAYTVQFDLQTGPSSPNFDGTVFTAPLSGFYQFSSSINCSGINSSNITGLLFLQTTSQAFTLWDKNPFVIINSGGDLSIGGAATVFLNAGDTVFIQLLIDLNMTDNVNVLGDPASAYTYFSGSYIGTSMSGGGGSGEIDVINDNSTNATMFPVWVTDTSGAQPTYVSSQGFQWNPSTQTFKIGNDNFGDNISISADIIRWGNGVNNPNWDMGELSGPGFGPPNWSIYDYNNSTFLLIADTEGDLGPNPTTLYFMYPYNSFPNSTTANKLMATDSNNLVTSVTNILGEVNITDDNSTDAPMNLTWVTGNSGNQPVYTSSDELQWNPGRGNLTITNPGPYGPTIHLNSTAAPGSADSWVYYESSGTLKAAMGYRDSLSAFSIYLGGDRMFINSSGVVTIPQLTASQLVATDGSSNLVSAGAYATDFNGITVASTVGIASTTVLSSQSFRMGNFGQTTGKINFTTNALTTNVTIIINLPFGTSFTASNQASGVISVGGFSTNTAVPGVIDSVSGQGLEINILTTVAGTYDLYFSAGYSISN